MKQFSAEGMVIIVGIVIAYILFTTADGGCAVKQRRLYGGFKRDASVCGRRDADV